MGTKSDKIQAAVYQIDTKAFENESFDEIVTQIVAKINKNASLDSQYKADKLSNYDFKEFQVKVYYAAQKKVPKWSTFLQPILADDAGIRSIRSLGHSYICFIGYKEYIFATAGGSGSLALDTYIVQDFGMEILVRLFYKHNRVIKAIHERAFTGIVLGQSKFYRGDQRFSDENQFGRIYKQVQAELDKNILTTILGFKEIELQRKVSGCLAKSSFQINKAIDFDTLLRLVGRFTEILKLDPNFALNKVKLIARRNKSNSVLLKALSEQLVNCLYNNCKHGIISDFDFCHQEFDKFLTASVYRLVVDSDVCYEFEEPITLKCLIDKLKEDERLLLDDAIDFKHSLLKLWLETADDDGNVLTRGEVLDHIHGEISFNGNTFFLIDGEWYHVDQDFIAEINQECKEILQHTWDTKLITELFDLEKRESEFNIKFLGHPDAFVFDTITPENIEACDFLKYDNDTVHLVHVKKGFDNAIRDLSAQLAIAAKRLKADRTSGYPYIAMLEDKTQRALFSDSPFKKKLGRQTFPAGGLKTVFEGKKDRNIVFCLAFADTASQVRNLRDHLDAFDSNVAKFALIQVYREIISYGFDFKVIQLPKANS